METNTGIILNKLKSFTPQNADWITLEDILEELFNSDNPEPSLNAMLSIYERYPDEDNEVLWGMLHGIESIEYYEQNVIESLNRKPSFFGVLMINRLLNAGITAIGNVNLLDTLKLVTVNSSATSYVKEEAERFLQKHSIEK
ncbi:MAG: hypothetical protein K0R50_2143 [Eubacterium sp.]|jgi:hypothetical protein|nr:hypothetical protein [Eubacterium sp.]